MTKEFNLSDKILEIDRHYVGGDEVYVRQAVSLKDVREFISLIQAKVLMYWKGQNEFVDWLNKKTGEKLT